MSDNIIKSLDNLYKAGILDLEQILELLNKQTTSTQQTNTTGTEDSCTENTVPPGYKKCHRCGEVLPIDHFNKDNARSDGLFVWCKQCSKEYNKQYLQKKKEERQHNNTTIGHKKCSNCGQVLPIDSFDKDSGKKDGHNSWCKECRRIYNRQQVQKNKKRNEDNVTPLTGYKKCIKCGQVLPIDQFNKNRTKKDGLSTWCSDCCKEYAEQYRQKNREKNTKENNNCDDLYIQIDSIDNEQLINSIKQILLKYKGEQTVYVCEEQSKKMFRWQHIRVNINCELIIELQELLGGDNVLVTNTIYKQKENKEINTKQRRYKWQL